MTLRRVCLALTMLTVLPAAALAQSAAPGVLDEIGQPAKPQVSDEIARFCSNIGDAARERRHALQTAELQKLQGELDDRIALLEKSARNTRAGSSGATNSPRSPEGRRRHLRQDAPRRCGAKNGRALSGNSRSSICSSSTPGCPA